MKIERTKNASRNIVFGVALKAYQILLPFVMRTAMIYFLGIQYLGLNSLFSSILQVLNLAELGVGSAMVYSMYKPIAEDDFITICALMRLYKKYYRIIGGVILAAGLSLVPFLIHLVKIDTVPKDISIYTLYLLNLGTTVLTYWLFAYKNCLLSAFQRNDIKSKINIVVSTVCYSTQFAILYYLRNYYAYTCVLLFSTVCNNLITARIVDKKYPHLLPKGELPEETRKAINQRIKDLFTAKLGGTIVGSADTIVISAFLGLTVLAIYQNYFFIMHSVIGIVMVVFSSTAAGIGNSLVTETKEKNYHDFRKFAFLINWGAVISISFFMCLYQPFIELWVGKDLLLDYSFVILFCVYFYVFIIQQLACVYKDAGGIWHSDRFRPLISGIVNLVLNLLFVKQWGLYAIILSTILSYVFVAMPWLIHNLFTLVLNRSSKEYVLFILTGFILSFIIGGICYYICTFIRCSPVIALIVRSIICLAVSNCLLFLLYRKHEMYNPMLDLIDNMLNKKAHTLIQRLKT
jgi:O-antigen/teichoic acid export membrane protein